MFEIRGAEVAKKLPYFLAWGLVFSSLLAFADQIDSGELGWFFDLVVHFTPHLIVAGIVVSISLLAVKAPGLLIATVCIVGVHTYSVLGHNNFVKPSSGKDVASNTISIVTANIWGNANALSKLGSLVEANKVDVVAISEMTRDTCTDLAREFPSYPYCRIVDRNKDGAPLSKRMALVSKDMPLSFSIIAKPEFRNRAIIDAVYEHNSREIQVVVVHPVAPGSPAHMRDRNHVLLSTNSLVEDKEHFILVGDMNTTPWSRIARQLPGVRAGDPKLESTWLTRLPLIGLPIDHIRISDSFNLIEYRVGPHIGSDHRPLIAKLHLRGSAN